MRDMLLRSFFFMGKQEYIKDVNQWLGDTPQVYGRYTKDAKTKNKTPQTSTWNTLSLTHTQPINKI